jgi:hypothetical protein
MSLIDINHHGVEFGYELGAVIPYAYWLHKKGRLGETHSHKDTSCLYYFNHNHHEDLDKRHSGNLKKCLSDKKIPNIKIHMADLNYSKWAPPPYKDRYKNSEHRFDVVVTNKFNREWGGRPVNFYTPDMLDKIFTLLEGKTVLYNHMTSDMGRDDTVESLELGEWGVVNKHPHVTKVQDIGRDCNYSYNEFQMRVYSNCDLFITVQGGTCMFASYFGGTNIIYAVKGQELRYDSYNTWYPKLGGSNIIHKTDYEEILESIKQYNG